MLKGAIYGIVPGGLGSLILLAGITVYFSCLYVARFQVKQFLIIDSPSHPQFDSWVRGEYGSNIGQTTFHFASITNPSEVLLGAKPNCELIGPFDYRVLSHKEDVAFYDGGSRVRFNQTFIYQEIGSDEEANVTRPNSDETVVTSLNYALISTFRRRNPRQISLLFASGALRWLLRDPTDFEPASQNEINADLWLNNGSHCFSEATNGACSLARYCSENNLSPPNVTFPQLNSSGALLILQDLASVSGMTQFVREYVALYGGANATVVPQDSNYFSIKWQPYLQLASPSQSSVLMDYLLSTAASAVAEMQRKYCGDSIFFLRHTVRERLFSDNPFLLFLADIASAQDPRFCFVCNISAQPSILQTGFADEAYMGMDYFESVVTPGVESKYLSGRTQSTAPFLYDVPPVIDILSLLSRRVQQYNYSGTSEYKGLKVRRYTNLLDGFDDLEGASGMPIALSRLGLRGTGIYGQRVSLFGDDPLLTDEEALSAPRAQIHAEVVSGLGVDNKLSSQLNVKLNFTSIANQDDPFGSSGVPSPLVSSSSGGYGSLAWNKTLSPDGLLYVPDMLFIQRRFANDAAASFLLDQTTNTLQKLDTLLIITLTLGAILVAMSMAWLVWETEGTAILREGGDASGK